MLRTASMTVLLVGASALAFAAGCSSTPAPNAPTSAAATATPPQKRAEPSASASADATNVHVDDEILRACGIQAPEAFFAFDSSHVRANDSGPLSKIATCFESGPLKGRSLKLIGRADPRGETEYNMTLGQSRADSVASYLHAKGVDKQRLVTTSRGAMDATGSDESSWQRDRRVDLTLGS
jgi:peptidoglycan-associated lipoprotein